MSRAAAVARPSRSRSTDEKESPWNDVFGILLLMAASMLLLALLSYDSRDMPAWSHLSHSDTPEMITQNFMGIIGAVLAGYGLFFVGFAAYLVPISITWFGVCKLHSKTRLSRIGWMGVGVLVVSAAALMQTMGLFEQNVEVAPAGGGGVVGRLIGDVLFMTLIGQVGSLWCWDRSTWSASSW